MTANSIYIRHFSKCFYFLFLLFSLSLSLLWPSSNEVFASDENQNLIELAQITPMVVRMGGEVFNYEVKVTDPNITQLEITGGAPLCLYNFAGFGFEQNLSSLILRDDGLNGDQRANDQIFTLQGLTVPDLGENYASVWATKANAETWNSAREQQVTVSFANGSQLETSLHLDAACGSISDAVPTPSIVDLEGDDRATTNVLSLTIPTTVFPYPYYTDLGLRYSQELIIERALAYLKGEYDWIIVQEFSGASNFYIPRSRPWVGVSEFPLQAYGVAPTWLRGMLYDQSGWASAIGSSKGSQPFGGDYNTTNHELLHTWASFLPTELSISDGTGHYGVIIEESSCFNGNGIHSYLSYEYDQAAGQVALPITGRGLQCNSLELYLMGLLPSTEVTPITVMVNPGQSQFAGETIVYPVDGVREVSIEEIISSVGERVPLPVEPKPVFKAAMVLVHDRKLTDNEIALFDYRMKNMAEILSEHGTTFQEVVSNRATLSTEIQLNIEGTPSSSDWPGLFNGTVPKQELNLALNNIGIFSNTDQTIYTCLRLFNNGIESELGGVNKFDVAFTIDATGDGTISFARARPFNQTAAVNATGAEPSCSGMIDIGQGKYQDIIQVGEETLSVEFSPVDATNSRFKLTQAVAL